MANKDFKFSGAYGGKKKSSTQAERNEVKAKKYKKQAEKNKKGRKAMNAAIYKASPGVIKSAYDYNKRLNDNVSRYRATPEGKKREADRARNLSRADKGIKAIKAGKADRIKAASKKGRVSGRLKSRYN